MSIPSSNCHDLPKKHKHKSLGAKTYFVVFIGGLLGAFVRSEISGFTHGMHWDSGYSMLFSRFTFATLLLKVRRKIPCKNRILLSLCSCSSSHLQQVNLLKQE